ncbi:MAG TPA: BON domain-containing protein [Vicinamibacterales bacterium]|jgi:osmotically-inducible protein OsmY|nr:BON domain-containing protein [Vicinamibacterales bacterium]
MTRAAAILLVLAAACAACSEKARKETREAADAVASDARSNADRALDATKEAGQKAKEIAGDVADAGKEAASAVGEAGSDTWITAKLKVKFADEQLLQKSRIDVSTRDHVVTLTGSVPSAAAKARAETVAKGTQGVVKVVNHLSVTSLGY